MEVIADLRRLGLPVVHSNPIVLRDERVRPKEKLVSSDHAASRVFILDGQSSMVASRVETMDPPNCFRDLPHCPPSLLKLREKRRHIGPPAARTKIVWDEAECEVAVEHLMQSFRETGGVYDKLRNMFMSNGGCLGEAWRNAASHMCTPGVIPLIMDKEFAEGLLTDDRVSGVERAAGIAGRWLQRTNISRGFHELQLSKNGTALAILKPDVNPARYFCCVILHPFFAESLDPASPLTYSSQHRIASEVFRLASWVESTDSATGEELLNQLREESAKLQTVVEERQHHVLQCLKEWLSDHVDEFGTISKFEPFGSVELGLSAFTSDIDVRVVLETAKSAPSLVQIAQQLLASHPPAWLRPNSVKEATTARVPVLSFEVKFDISAWRDGIQRISTCLKELQLHSEHSSKHGPKGSEETYVGVDLTFVVSDAANATLLDLILQKDMINFGDKECTMALLVWLKYWTKATGLNAPTEGTLSSFAWRHILLSFLMEQGVVPCLRNDMCIVAEPPLLNGINVWRCSSPPDGWVPKKRGCNGIWKYLQAFAAALGQCCLAPGSMSSPPALFQTNVMNHDVLNSLAESMSSRNVLHIREDILELKQCVAENCKLLFVDVDGVLFDIDDCRRDTALDDKGEFFFNTPDSIPQHCAEHVELFAISAQRAGFSVIVISGRDESVLSLVRTVVEMGELRPDKYFFKDHGSRESTAVFKGSIVCQMVRALTPQVVGFLDDMDAHMSAMIDAVDASNVHVELFALTAFSQPERGIRLRPWNSSTKHIVLPMLPQGGRKGLILQSVKNRLGNECSIIDSEDTSGRDAYWPVFVKNALNRLREPGVRILLVNMIPNRGVVPKLAQLLGSGGTVVCVEQHEDASSEPERHIQCLACLRNLLHSNERRSLKCGESKAYVQLPSELDSVWPSDDKFNTWAEKVWKGEPNTVGESIVRVWGTIRRRYKASREIHTLARNQSSMPLRFHRVSFFKKASEEQISSASAGLALLDKQGAASSKSSREHVKELMGNLKDGTGIVGMSLALQRDPDDIAADIVDCLIELLQTGGAAGTMSNLDQNLANLVD